jgi:hypothetical protein
VTAANDEEELFGSALALRPGCKGLGMYETYHCCVVFSIIYSFLVHKANG